MIVTNYQYIQRAHRAAKEYVHIVHTKKTHAAGIYTQRAYGTHLTSHPPHTCRYPYVRTYVRYWYRVPVVVHTYRVDGERLVLYGVPVPV